MFCNTHTRRVCIYLPRKRSIRKCFLKFPTHITQFYAFKKPSNFNGVSLGKSANSSVISMLSGDFSRKYPLFVHFEKNTKKMTLAQILATT